MNLNYFFSRLFSKTAFVSLAIITSIFAIASQPVFAESAIATPAAKVETSKADRNHQIDEIAKSPIFLEGKACEKSDALWSAIYATRESGDSLAPFEKDQVKTIGEYKRFLWELSQTWLR